MEERSSFLENIMLKKDIKRNKYQSGFTPSEIMRIKFNLFKIKMTKFFINKKQNLRRFQSGFTLVEMIVAVALFSVVMVMGMGALLNVLSANKQNQAIQTAVNNLSLAMEMMSREIRMGYNYHCGDCVGVSCVDTSDCNYDDAIAFEAYNGDPNSPSDQVIFKFENSRLKKSIDGGSSFLDLTAEDLVLEGSYFAVRGSDSTDSLQPKVLIVINGEASATSKANSPFNLQTTISQRIIDF